VFFIFIPFWGHKNGVHVGNDPAAFFLNYFHFSPTLPLPPSPWLPRLRVE